MFELLCRDPKNWRETCSTGFATRNISVSQNKLNIKLFNCKKNINLPHGDDLISRGNPKLSKLFQIGTAVIFQKRTNPMKTPNRIKQTQDVVDSGSCH